MNDSSANTRQVGGAHYAGTYQHWDFAEDAGLAGHEWQVTRYISRHRRKAGLQDVLKAGHHVQKMIELLRSRGRKPGHGPAAARAFERFVTENSVNFEDALVISAMCVWHDERGLTMCMHQIDRIANEYRAAEAAEMAKTHDTKPVVLSTLQIDAVDETAGLPPAVRGVDEGEGDAPD